MNMFQTLLTQNRKAIRDRWFSLIAKTYPEATAQFLMRETNRFANPVGQTIAGEIERLLDALISGEEPVHITSSLDEINRIRAVQQFSASQAVVFVFLLKTAIREELAGHLREGSVAADLLSFESRIDGLALAAFDSYMRCREKLFDVKVNDIKRRASLIPGTKDPNNI